MVAQVRRTPHMGAQVTTRGRVVAEDQFGMQGKQEEPRAQTDHDHRTQSLPIGNVVKERPADLDVALDWNLLVGQPRLVFHDRSA